MRQGRLCDFSGEIQNLADSDDPGRLARAGYTYVHILVVAGIAVAAVADEFLLAHPTGHIDIGIVTVIVGGPAMFLLGTAIFKRLTGPNFPLSHIGGLVLFAALAWLAVWSDLQPTPLFLGAAAALVLVIVAVWERISLSSEHRRITH